MSGVNAERDQTKKAWLLRDYGLMRVSNFLMFIFIPFRGGLGGGEVLTFAV